MRKFTIINKGKLLSLLALAATLCGCTDDLKHDITSLSDRMHAAEEAITDLQSKIDAGGLVKEVVKTDKGFDVYFSGLSTSVVSLTNGVDGKDGINGTNGTNGKDGADGKDGINGTNGTNGKDGADGKDGINGTNGKDGADGKDGINGTNGTDGKDGADGKDGINGTNGTDGKDGADGKDVTVSSITYRDMGDYGLFFFEAIDDKSQPRVIYIPMDVQTPTSVTLLTEKLSVKVGETTTVDVVVNPTANAKDIVSFYLVGYGAYTRSASVYNGPGNSGLEISDVLEGGNGIYAITIKCTKDYTFAANEALYIAAKYSVNTYTGDTGYVTADKYTSYKSAAAPYDVYNSSESHELLSSTPILGVTTSFPALPDTDVVAQLNFPNYNMYPADKESFDILTSKTNLYKVKSVTMSPDKSNVLDLSYASGKITVEAKNVTTKTTVKVDVKITDHNSNVRTRSFNVVVYPNTIASILNSSTTETISTWLPANVIDGVTGTSSSIASKLNKDFTYDFSAPDVKISATFIDDYKIGLLGVTVSDEEALKLVKSATYSSVSNTISIELNNSSELLLQPGTYQITMLGNATPKGTDLDDIDAKLIQTIKVQAPEYKFSFAAAAAVTNGTYKTSTWSNINLENLVDHLSGTIVGIPVYPYIINTVGDNVITQNGVRSLVSVNYSTPLATKTVTFPTPSSTVKDVTAEALFYCELNTGVKLPAKTATTPSYSKLIIDYNAITLNTVTLKYNNGLDISYSAIQDTYSPLFSYTATQNSVVFNQTSTQPQINGKDFDALFTYKYELVGDVLYYDKNGFVSGLPAGNPFTEENGIVSIDEKTGVLTTTIPKNLVWDGVLNGVTYGQKVKVSVTDIFGTQLTSNIYEVKISK